MSYSDLITKFENIEANTILKPQLEGRTERYAQIKLEDMEWISDNFKKLVEENEEMVYQYKEKEE